MIKLIATDIDGTILKYDFQFNEEVKSCIKTLVQDGVRVVLATGRMHSATTHISDELGLNSPIISYQGGLVKDENGKTIYEKNLDPKRAKKIIAWARSNDVHLNLYMNDELFVEKDDDVIKRYTKERHASYIVKDFSSLDLGNINKMLAIDFENPDNVTRWKDYLLKAFPDVSFVKSMPFFCEVCHLEATKFHAVRFLQEYYGLKNEEILTIGDQDNDISLLKAGGVKVAMGNATEGLKAVADYVTDTVNNNGFVKAVEKFVYNKVDA